MKIALRSRVDSKFAQLVENAEMLPDIRDYDEVVPRIASGEEELKIECLANLQSLISSLV